MPFIILKINDTLITFRGW